MYSITNLSNHSIFIRNIIKHGYDPDTPLLSLLSDLELPRNTNDIHALFHPTVIPNYCNIIKKVHAKININHLVMVCDEISMSTSIYNILSSGIVNTLMSDDIINNNFDKDKFWQIEPMWARGFRIISKHTNYFNNDNENCNDIMSKVAALNGMHKTCRLIGVINSSNTFNAGQNAISETTSLLVGGKSDSIDLQSYRYSEDINLFKNVRNIRVNDDVIPLRQSFPNFVDTVYMRRSIGTQFEFSNSQNNDVVLSLCTRLCTLDVSNNITITTCAPFAKSLTWLGKLSMWYNRCGTCVV